MTEPPPAGRRGPDARQALTALSVGLLVAWAVWWAGSVRRDRLERGGLTWVNPLPHLAGDFTAHIDHVARVYASGVNPYEVTFEADPFCAWFPYPPMVLRVFAWVALVSTPTAVKLWLAALAGCLAAGAVAAASTRRALGLTPVPLAALLVALAYSTPAVFAMERGQSDPMVVPMLAGAAWLLGRRSGRSELLAGALLGVTAWMKYYPGFAVLGLIPLRRWRGLAAAAAVGLVILAADHREVLRSVENGRIHTTAAETPVGVIHPLAHSLVQHWKSFALVRAFRPLSTVPGAVAAAAVLVPAVGFVGWQVGRARGTKALVFPTFAWLTAAATYAMPYSNDYNLVPLLAAALAVWDRRDPPWVHASMAWLALWWQPWQISVGGTVMMAAKLGGLLAVGACLAARARESAGSASESESESGAGAVEGPRPHFAGRRARRATTAGG